MLKTLRRIVLDVESAADDLQAFNTIATGVRHVLHADCANLFLVDAVKGEYVLVGSDGLPEMVVGKIRIKFGKGVIGVIGEREEPINLADATEHPNFYKPKLLADKTFKGYIGVPIIHKAKLVGIIVAQQIEAIAFGQEEEAFLITLAIQLATIIDRAIAKGILQRIGKRRTRKTATSVLNGVSGAAGIAIGRAVVIFPPADLEAVPDQAADDIEAEIRIFETALADAREEIYALQSRAKLSLSVAENALFDAYLRMLDSRTLMNEVETEIRAGVWAQSALKRVIKRHIAQFESLEDAYLRERASDLRDLGRRVLFHLQEGKAAKPDYGKDTILVSDEVSATALMEVPQGQLVGVVSGAGSSNSHVAILARSLGVPTVMGVSGMPLFQLANRELIVDGYNGQVYVSPPTELRKEFQQLAQEEQQLDEELSALHDLPAETKDSHVVTLYVNTGLAMEGGLSLSAGAEGVGLFRTEMPFMMRERFPSEEEQRIMYRQLLTTFAPRPVAMRTLDIGGDKNLPYFPIEEDNPFLGWRGIRVTLDHPEIFLQQVRAMLRANAGIENMAIMLPMISAVREVEESLRLINQAYQEIAEDVPDLLMPPIGVMIEVPAAVYQTYEIARRVDFISVGSNDLVQYFLAVDRNNPRVAHLYNSLHPAVLKALVEIVKAGHKAGKKVSICGELAADPIAVILLVGMGFDVLSMNARSLPRVKWIIRHVELTFAKSLLKEVLKMDDSDEVRLHLESALVRVGLGALIRAGK